MPATEGGKQRHQVVAARNGLPFYIGGVAQRLLEARGVTGLECPGQVHFPSVGLSDAVSHRLRAVATRRDRSVLLAWACGQYTLGSRHEAHLRPSSIREFVSACRWSSVRSMEGPCACESVPCLQHDRFFQVGPIANHTSSVLPSDHVARALLSSHNYP